MTCWPIAALMVLCLVGSIRCGAPKIQNPADDLSTELNHPRYLEALQVCYLNLDNVVSKLYEPDNLLGNMELINGLLESERKMPTLLRGVKMLNECLDLFRSLSGVYDECNYESYKSLVQNYRAVDGRSHELFENRRAIEMMIYDYAVAHAQECGPKYVQQFEQISARPAVKVVTSIVDEVLRGLDADSLLVGENGADASRYRPENVIEMGVMGLDLSNYGFHTIVKNIENLVQGKSEASYFYAKLDGSSKSPSLPKEFETNIFNKYLIVPCQQYNELFRDVFAPARFDAMIDQEREMIVDGPIFPSSSEQFNTAWIQYRTCKHLAGWADRKDLLSLVGQVAKSLTKRSAV